MPIHPHHTGNARLETMSQPEKSELIARIHSTDDDLRMPPPETKKKLTDAEKALLKQWIAEGAKYQTHWAFSAPQKPA